MSGRAGPTLALALLGRRGRCRIICPFETIRTVPGRSGFALAAEELILELAVLSAKQFDLGFESLGPLNGPSMHPFPIPGLLPQFGVLTPQFADFQAQVENFATKLPHEFGQISRLGDRKGHNKRVVHNKNACNVDPISKEGPPGSQKTGWAKLYAFSAGSP